MAQEMKTASGGGVEWRVTVGDGSSKTLVPNKGIAMKMKDLIIGLFLKVWKFLQKAWQLGRDDPRKFMHCLKVGMALTVVSLFYYMRPLYDGFGGNAMWAVMTVVVVFENTVGATIYKCLNRICGTALAGFLAIGVHWVATQSGENFEPFIVGVSVFLLASAATFSRFIPKVKELFDYGALIFILTFSLVAVSGYRVDKLFDMAHERVSTVIVGTSLCILVSMLICPIWAGQELYVQICRNLEKLANSLDGHLTMYFNHDTENSDGRTDKELLGYKCVLGSKAAEETLAIFARWEPCHGHFSFKHPWKQYVKIGASIRSCAYCIEALRGCIDSDDQAPEFITKHLSKKCLKVSSSSASIIRELATTIKTMSKPSKLNSMVEDMTNAAEELQNAFQSLPNSCESESVSLMEILPAATLASMLTEITTRVEAIVDAVKELAKMAEFKDESHELSKQNQGNNTRIVPDDHVTDEEATMKALQRV